MEYLSKELHEEFAKRMEEEHTRQNKRIANLETKLEENNKLLSSVERLAISVENMQKQLTTQGLKIDELESRDGESWRKFVGYVISAVVGGVIVFVFKQLGM